MLFGQIVGKHSIQVRDRPLDSPKFALRSCSYARIDSLLGAAQSFDEGREFKRVVLLQARNGRLLPPDTPRDTRWRSAVLPLLWHPAQ